MIRIRVNLVDTQNLEFGNNVKAEGFLSNDKINPSIIFKTKRNK